MNICKTINILVKKKKSTKNTMVKMNSIMHKKTSNLPNQANLIPKLCCYEFIFQIDVEIFYFIKTLSQLELKLPTYHNS